MILSLIQPSISIWLFRVDCWIISSPQNILSAFWHIVRVVAELTIVGAVLVGLNVKESKPDSNGICQCLVLGNLVKEVLAGDNDNLNKEDCTLAFTSMLPYLMLTRQGLTLMRDFSKGKIVLLVVPSRSSIRMVDCPL